ncbi:hypothetical protein [Dubosiella newyorkensis]|uniref:hypothetical protein n=1 Tax=Dubosiella newyorkensis TaxID=1862672 RepID=UPI002590487F|nr:hypothetical protein [Dubosiella newyorkensis]
MTIKNNDSVIYNRDRFYGAYVQQMRRYYVVSQKDMANKLHLSSSALSKIESGQQNMDLVLFDKAIAFFEELDRDYRFIRDVSKVIEAENWIDRCLNGFLNLSYSDLMEELKSYLDHMENKHSLAHFHYSLIELFNALFNNEGSMKNVENLIDSGYFADSYHLAILYDLHGIIEDFTAAPDIQIQIESLKRALLYAEQCEDFALIGLIEYHLNYHYSDANDLIRALASVEQAKKHFQRSGCYRRLISAQMNEANIYLKMRIYSKAEEIYLSLLTQREQVQNDFLGSTLYENLAWCEFLQEKDKKALTYALKAKDEKSTFPDIDIVLVFSNYRLQRFEQARQFAKLFLDHGSKEERVKFIKLFMRLVLQVLDQKSDLSGLINEIQSQLSSFQMVELEIPFYSLLIDHYQSKNEWEQTIKYQDLLIKYLKLNFNNH